MDLLKISGFDNISQNKAILERDNTGYAYNYVGEVTYGLIIIFGAGHIEIQYGRRANCILLYGASTQRARYIYMY